MRILIPRYFISLKSNFIIIFKYNNKSYKFKNPLLLNI